MSALNFIIDQPLPLNQDYRALKQKALAFIQLHSGHQWTNLNNVDPGVTILEQLCYALTELGYCNDFPVADILTDLNGNLEVKDQFYLPEEILTTAPVTINDYRKCLIDGVSGVANAVIVVVPVSPENQNRAYQVYLQAYANLNAAEREVLCQAAYIYLNQWRNLGELFLLPICLVDDVHTVAGTIEIANEAQLNSILVQLQQCVKQAIFPQVIPLGYNAPEAYKIPTDELFNGPLLHNGWIPTSALGEKKNQLQLIELQQLILSVPGVMALSGLMFDGQAAIQEISSNAEKLLSIDWSASLKNGLAIYCKGRKLVASADLRVLAGMNQQTADVELVFGATPNIRTNLPKGTFRDINTYYSVQNTFPAIFAVGENTTIDNATDFQLAQSRQLKGYLTLFDQVLANQFAQLANVGTLFSFKNAQSGTPSDQSFFYATKNRLAKLQDEYPVPYLTFSPTYFYQSLYAVPHIRPLLKDNETYNFCIAAETETELENSSWIAYKKDPYNAYIKGLMDIMEEEQTNLLRRNQMLDHLLARHGESPLLINTLLNGSVYAGESLKDQVIFKSLYLQNLGLLSYFRQKAYNFMGAKKLADHFANVPLNFDAQIMGGYNRDFIFDSTKIDRMEALTTADFIDYAALELKLSLLFGLKALYRDYIANHFDEAANAINLKLAMWMIMERKGLLLIETALLSLYTTLTPGTEEIIVVFPDFIPVFNTDSFNLRLALFMEETMPVQVTYRCCFLSSSQLEIFIIAYTDWHNGLIEAGNTGVKKNLTANAASLMKVINLINSAYNVSK